MANATTCKVALMKITNNKNGFISNKKSAKFLSKVYFKTNEIIDLE